MLRNRKINGIFWDDVSIFKDNAVLKKFKSDQSDWSVQDWIRFHKELISYYLINKWTKSQAEKKATDIVYTDYMNLNFYSRPGLDCEGANYFAKFGIEKDFFTKLICAGVEIKDAAGVVIENIGTSAKKTANITTKIQENLIPLAILGGIGFYLFKHSKNGKKTKKR